MLEENRTESIQFRAAIVLFGEENQSGHRHASSEEKSMRDVLTDVDYVVKEEIEIPADLSVLRKTLLRLTDEEEVNVVFLNNLTGDSVNDYNFEMEERWTIEDNPWMRIWTRQRILYNDFNHAITVLRGKTLIFNFEHEFKVTGNELADILNSWRDTCIAENHF